MRAASRLGGAPLIATGQGLAPFGPETLQGFDHVSVRDAPSAQRLGIPQGVDDAYLVERMPVPERSAPTELVLCVQSDAVDDGAFERLIGHVRRTVGASGIPRERVRYVEALPGGDFAGYDRLRDLVAEDGFVPFTRFWRGEFSPAAHQVWLTTRFHHHLVAALHGARGIALTAKTGYYDVKHGSLVEGGSRWRVQDGTGEVLDLSQLPDPAPAADSIAAKTAEAQLLYGRDGPGTTTEPAGQLLGGLRLRGGWSRSGDAGGQPKYRGRVPSRSSRSSSTPKLPSPATSSASPPVEPRRSTGTPCSAAREVSCSSCAAGTATRARACDSENSALSRSTPSRSSSSVRSTEAPVPNRTTDSTSACASPPSERSCAAVARPCSDEAISTVASERSASRSTCGGSPPRCWWSTSAQADPESSSRVVPSSSTDCPSPCQPEGTRFATSSNTPSTPTTGVGRMAESIRPGSPVELYSETLPPVTGTSSASHASARPSIASTSCHMGPGSSGEPKFRQSVIASGVAPAAATLR